MKNKCIFGLALAAMVSLVSSGTSGLGFTGSTEGQICQNNAAAKAPASESAVTAQVPPETTAKRTPVKAEIETAEKSQAVSMDWNDDESYMLAKISMAEAEGEDTKGKALVMLVVLNRVRDDEFPDSIEGVIFQEGQFSPVENGRYYEVEPDVDCYRALNLIRDENWDESQGATFFESRSGSDSTWHQKNLRYLFRHGNHYFYKDRSEE